MELLLLGCDFDRARELTSLFRGAGYQVVEVNDLTSCGRQLQGELSGSLSIPVPTPIPLSGPGVAPISAGGAHHGITIVNPGKAPPPGEARHKPELLSSILRLARQLAPGWRLSMRHRRLEAPNGAGIELTSLEFIFIRLFTMAEVGEAISRKKIVQAFGEDYLSYDQNRLDTMVRRLRKKIDMHLGLKLPLNTERVRGFSFGDVLIIEH